SVPPGTHELRVANPAQGFDRMRAVTLVADQNYFFEVRGRTGWVRVTVSPWAQVSIDGKTMGLTPLPRIGLLEGSHRIRLENPDIGRVHELTVRIEPGRETAINVDLSEVGAEL
ncbi:MAG: PEGA domain-containing protein, partial [Myxococcota bacterium]